MAEGKALVCLQCETYDATRICDKCSKILCLGCTIRKVINYRHGRGNYRKNVDSEYVKFTLCMACSTLGLEDFAIAHVVDRDKELSPWAYVIFVIGIIAVGVAVRLG